MAIVSAANNQIQIMASMDGANWIEAGPVTNGDSSYVQQSKAAPALCMFNGAYVMVYVANDHTNHLYVTTSTDGLDWTPARHVMGRTATPKQASKAAPALAALQDALILTYLANDDSREVLVTTSMDGAHWVDAVPVSGIPLSSTPPALLNNMLTTMV